MGPGVFIPSPLKRFFIPSSLKSFFTKMGRKFQLKMDENSNDHDHLCTWVSSMRGRRGGGGNFVVGPGCFHPRPTKKFSSQNGEKSEVRKYQSKMDENSHDHLRTWVLSTLVAFFSSSTLTFFTKKMYYFFILFNEDIIVNLYQLYFLS